MVEWEGPVYTHDPLFSKKLGGKWKRRNSLEGNGWECPPKLWVFSVRKAMNTKHNKLNGNKLDFSQSHAVPTEPLFHSEQERYWDKTEGFNIRRVTSMKATGQPHPWEEDQTQKESRNQQAWWARKYMETMANVNKLTGGINNGNSTMKQHNNSKDVKQLITTGD